MAIGTVLLLAIGGPIAAQIPDEFTNLKVLPADTGKRELVSLMREFSSALGVRCNHCHVGEDPSSLEGYDFASDEPEHKKVARAMMKMTNEINDKLLPATGRRSPVRVRCVTCHHGIEHPEPLDAVISRVIEEQDVDAGIRRYRELRENYYGTGAYDFGAGTLNKVAEEQAQRRNDTDGAIALMQLNVELNPEAAYSHLLLGQLYASRGDKQAALASVQRCLDLEPDNSWAKRTLERLQAGD